MTIPTEVTVILCILSFILGMVAEGWARRSYYKNHDEDS